MKLQLSQNSIEFSRKNVTKYSRKFEITSSNRVQNPQIEDPLYGQAIVLYWDHSPEGVPVAAMVKFRFAIFFFLSPKDL